MKGLTSQFNLVYSPSTNAGVAELADAPDSKSGDGNIV